MSELAKEAAVEFIRKTGHEVTNVISNELGVCLELDGVEEIIFREVEGRVEQERVARKIEETKEQRIAANQAKALRVPAHARAAIKAEQERVA